MDSGGRRGDRTPDHLRVNRRHGASRRRGSGRNRHSERLSTGGDLRPYGWGWRFGRPSGALLRTSRVEAWHRRRCHPPASRSTVAARSAPAPHAAAHATTGCSPPAPSRAVSPAAHQADWQSQQEASSPGHPVSRARSGANTEPLLSASARTPAASPTGSQVTGRPAASPGSTARAGAPASAPSPRRAPASARRSEAAPPQPAPRARSECSARASCRLDDPHQHLEIRRGSAAARHARDVDRDPSRRA